MINSYIDISTKGDEGIVGAQNLKCAQGLSMCGTVFKIICLKHKKSYWNVHQ